MYEWVEKEGLIREEECYFVLPTALKAYRAYESGCKLSLYENEIIIPRQVQHVSFHK
jgi:hypothetical protein